MESTQFYLRLKHLIHSLDQQRDLAELDLVSMRVLEILALRHLEDKSMTVTEVMAMHTLGSPATLHRKLDALRESGYVESFSQPHDKRTKYLKPCTKAMNHFRALSNLVESSLERSGR
jgi:DNA-binding MarR family transcriptional regulator